AITLDDDLVLQRRGVSPLTGAPMFQSAQGAARRFDLHDGEGRPVTLQIAARHHSEDSLLLHAGTYALGKDATWFGLPGSEGFEELVHIHGTATLSTRTPVVQPDATGWTRYHP